MAFQSFSGEKSMRFPAPDVARGFILLLIALANVAYWIPVSSGTVESMSSLDQVWVLIRTGLVDRRAYPLFAALFGFGLMTMINRSVGRDMQKGIHPYWALDSARRLVRRRGWWMLLFGLAHAVIFPGDIIGTYAILAVIFAGLLVGKKYVSMAWIAAVVTVFALGFAVLELSLQQSLESAVTTGGAEQSFAAGVFAPVLGVLTWAVTSPLVLLISLVIPAAFIGARLADTDILANPQAHRGQLIVVAVGGLLSGFLASLPYGLTLAGFVQASAPLWSLPLNLAGGLAGAFGWLALLALLAGGPPEDGTLIGWRRILSNVGQRSMTAYVAQSVIFLGLYIAANWAGVWAQVSISAGAAVAVLVWLLTVLLCQLLASKGKRGPLEFLLRRAVTKGDWEEGNAREVSLK